MKDKKFNGLRRIACEDHIQFGPRHADDSASRLDERPIDIKTLINGKWVWVCTRVP